MKQNLITDVVQAMLPYLNNAQSEKLQEVLEHTLFDYEVTKNKDDEVKTVITQINKYVRLIPTSD